MKDHKLFLGGAWCASSDSTFADDINPATQAPFARVAQATPEDVDAAVTRATAASQSWAETPPSERERILLRAADVIERRADEIAWRLVEESGCTYGHGAYQAAYSADDLRATAAEARRMGGETIPSDIPGLLSMTVRAPLGVIAGIAPNNVPLALAMVKVDSALATGNAFVLKPSEETPIAGLIIAEVFEEAGLPAGLLSVLPGDGRVGKALVDHPDIRMICFTGSTATGKAIAEAAARGMKKVSLELGGKSPLLILADADIDDAVETAKFGIFSHQGQVCMASSRVIVEAPLYDAFGAALAEKAAALKVGDPTEPDTIIGPLIRAGQCAKIAEMIDDATAKGARLLTGGGYRGPYFEPTVIADVTPEMTLFYEEAFGPVVCLSRAGDIDEAIALANENHYGLSSAVLTKNTHNALRVARRIEAGMVHINATTIQCEPTVPFGGIKNSGLGREGSRYLCEAMTELKWITIQEGKRSYPF